MEREASFTDVAIVGGGIAGAALAVGLSTAGVDVAVLEASTRYEDRVRGETMQPWGVREAQRLGVDTVLTDAGAHINRRSRLYVETFDAPIDIDLSTAVPGVPGGLNLAHPTACQALIDAAASAGARVIRSVQDVTLTRGARPAVSYVLADGQHSIGASLVVGADGRASTVRRQAAIELEHQDAVSCVAGLLIDDLDGVPDDFDVLAATNVGLFVLAHQGGGRARSYLIMGMSGRHRFTGADRAVSFLDACRTTPYPWAEEVAAATPAGPVRTYLCDDTWTAEPFADAVVLIGDAAGYNDPIAAQGLSIALRDARMVRDLVLDGARDQHAFASYGLERGARMARLRLIADLFAHAYVEDASDRHARRRRLSEAIIQGDADIATLANAVFAGPEHVPDDLTDGRVLDRFRPAASTP